MPKPIHLWPDHAALAERLVASGRFDSVGEVVMHAFRLLEDQEAAREARLAKLHAHIAEGLADIEAGRTVPAEEVFAELRRRVADHHGSRDAAE